jgi:flagellar biosynthesis anti-sigma factor FlgM
MKVNNNNLSSLSSTEALGTQQTGRTGQAASSSQSPATGGVASSDDIHLSELVRSLRSLAADSPERQARIEQIARSYASGTYQVDPPATASKIVDDAFQRS